MGGSISRENDVRQPQGWRGCRLSTVALPSIATRGEITAVNVARHPRAPELVGVPIDDLMTSGGMRI
jgi:hypothetical protein